MAACTCGSATCPRLTWWPDSQMERSATRHCPTGHGSRPSRCASAAATSRSARACMAPHTRSRIHCGTCSFLFWDLPCCYTFSCHGRAGVRVSLPTVVFVALPFLITSNAALAVMEYWGLTLVFWLIGLLGMWAVQVGISAGGLQIMVLADRLVRMTAWRREEYLFADMAFVQPAIQIPPKWLITTSWLAALSGRRGSGAALLGAQSETRGFRITMKDGRVACIWLTDQMGTVMMRGAEALPRALAAAGVPMSTEGVTVRGTSVG